MSGIDKLIMFFVRKKRDRLGFGEDLMGKQLSEMSIEELWQLFPIILTEHKNYWKQWYDIESTELMKTLPSVCRISHIGSTAVDTIYAKPIIDILAEVPAGRDLLGVKDILISNGYICMNQEINRISFNKGYTENGFAQKVFHLHLRYAGDNDELYFRDYLNEHIEVAKDYEKIKLKLWKKYEYNRNGYTNAKTNFIIKYTNDAKLQYGNRYY